MGRGWKVDDGEWKPSTLYPLSSTKNKIMKNILFLFVPLFLLTACSGEEKKAVVKKSIRPVKYGKVAMSGDALLETFSGTAQSSKETKLSFKVLGTVTDLRVKVGDIVKQGELIARVDRTDYVVQYQQSVASLKSVETQIKTAQTQLVNSRATYNRIEKLYENNSVSLSEFEQAKSAYETAQSSYNAALAQATASEKQVESAQNQVNYSNLEAPYSGVITSVNVEENELVGSGTPIATISAINNPEISVGIPEIFISKVRKNQRVEIIFSAFPEITFTGKVYEVGFSSLGGSTYPVTVQIDKSTGDIRPGMAADVQFNFSPKGRQANQKMVAPVASVGEDSNSNFVFVLEKSDNHYIAKKKAIQIGELTSTGFEIKSGLSKGDLVATAGLSTLLDGMKVRLLK